MEWAVSYTHLHSTNGEFYTIESLEKYRCGEKSGVEAVKEAFSKGINWISTEDAPDTNLLQNDQNVKIKNQISEEYYYPFIEITKSPLSLRLLVPASDSIKILESIVKLYNQRFKKVIGKLPLNMGCLLYTSHHNRNDNIIINILKSCDRLDSADDKGIVRRKQSKDNAIISSPFGFDKEIIELKCLQKRLHDLQSNLTGLFQNYISGNVNIECLRNLSLIHIWSNRRKNCRS